MDTVTQTEVVTRDETSFRIQFNESQQAVLLQKTPAQEIRWRPIKGGGKAPYTDAAFVIRTLNQAFGWDWSFEVPIAETVEFNGLPFQIKAKGRLSVRLPDGRVIVKEQWGSQDIEYTRGENPEPVSIGDAYKGASTDALKKCSAMLGVALDLYDNDSDVYAYGKSEDSMNLYWKAMKALGMDGDAGKALLGKYGGDIVKALVMVVVGLAKERGKKEDGDKKQEPQPPTEPPPGPQASGIPDVPAGAFPPDEREELENAGRVDDQGNVLPPPQDDPVAKAAAALGGKVAGVLDEYAPDAHKGEKTPTKTDQLLEWVNGVCKMKGARTYNVWAPQLYNALKDCETPFRSWSPKNPWTPVEIGAWTRHAVQRHVEEDASKQAMKNAA